MKSDQTNLLAISGIRSSTNPDQKSPVISLDDATPDDTIVMSTIVFDGEPPSYLPVLFNDKKNKVDLLSFSVDHPHI